MNIIQLTEKDFKTGNWAGGTTTQFFIYPPTSNYEKRNFILRISSATIDTDKSEFTPLPNVQRFIASLSGNLKISHDEKYFIKLKPYEIYTFDGGIKTISEGKVKDFNVMVKAGVEASVKNFFLNASSLLKFDIAKNELGWIFSFNNVCSINIDGISKHKIDERNSFRFDLNKMTLLIFTSEENRIEEKESFTVSTDKNISLFYGKIKL